MYSEFRNQFIMGKKIIKSDWELTRVSEELFLSSHKDLEVTQFSEGDKSFTLIGYIIDPHNPDNSNLDCLTEITEKSKTLSDIPEAIYKYSGRFIIVAVIEGIARIYTDPCSLRQVFYLNLDGDPWYASQPNLLNNVLNLQMRDEKELIRFTNSEGYENSQRCWIGNDTVFKDVYHLLPNHYLDLRDNTQVRYWLNNESSLGLADAVEKSSKILRGSLNAIAQRGNLIQGLTAGWDSRVLLAASKEVKSKVKYYVSLGDDKLSKSTDLRIAKLLAEQLDLNLLVMNNLEEVRPEIEMRIKNDVTQGRKLRKTRTIQYFNDHFERHININGNISEIVRFFYGMDHPIKVDSEYLLSLLKLEGLEFPKKNLDDWLKGIPESVLKEMHTTDLLYWEQKMGNWCAMQKAEQDIAIEDFSPFNNRELLMVLNSVDSQFRKPNHNVLYTKIIENSWSETLKQPINPVDLKTKVFKSLKFFVPDKYKKKVKSVLAK